MEELIYLESDEEITSVIDKLKTIESNSVGLVIPQGASLIQSVVNLKLLQKEAKALGKEIAVISQDKIGRNLASQIGLTVYVSADSPKPVVEIPKLEIPNQEVIEIDLSEKKSVEAAGVKVNRYDNSSLPAVSAKEELPTHVEAKPISAEDYKMPETHAPKKPRNWKKLLLVVVPIIAILILLYIFYPKAIVTLAVKTQSFEQSIDVTLDNNINKIDVTRAAMPGDLQEVESEESKDYDATGKKEVGEKASGKITIYNEWDGSPHSYPSGTKLTGGGKTFLANDSFTVPAGTLSGGAIQAGKIDITATAEAPGDSYNLSSTTFVVAGAPTKIYGRNASNLSGGSTRELTIVSSEDLNKAKDNLVGEIDKKNHDALVKKAGDQKIIDSSIEDEVISSSTNKNVNDEASQFKLTVKVKSRTLSFKEDDFRSFLGQILASNIPNGKKLVPTTADEISISKSENNFSQGLMKLTGSVKTSLAPNIDENKLKKEVANKNKSDAEVILRNIPDTENSSITFRPAWWLKKVPSLERNIKIEFNYLTITNAQ